MVWARFEFMKIVKKKKKKKKKKKNFKEKS